MSEYRAFTEAYERWKRDAYAEIEIEYIPGQDTDDELPEICSDGSVYYGGNLFDITPPDTVTRWNDSPYCRPEWRN